MADGERVHVPINERSLRTMMKRVPVLIGKDVLWDGSKNEVTIEYENKKGREMYPDGEAAGEALVH